MKRAPERFDACPASGRRARAHGQALVEFLVTAGLLVTLAIGITVLGRLQDLQSVTAQAARYAAFEQAGTERPDPVALLERLRARFFAAPVDRIEHDDRLREEERWRDTNPHWIDHSRRGNPLITRPADVTLEVADSPPPGSAGTAVRAITGAADATARLTGRRFDVDRSGYRAVSLSVRVAPLAHWAELEPLDLALVERVALLTGDWSADAPAQVAERTGALVPAAAIQRVRPLVDGLRGALALLEPRFRDLCLGRVDPEVVPADRLGAPGTAQRGDWRASC